MLIGPFLHVGSIKEMIAYCFHKSRKEIIKHQRNVTDKTRLTYLIQVVWFELN